LLAKKKSCNRQQRQEIDPSIFPSRSSRELAGSIPDPGARPQRPHTLAERFPPQADGHLRRPIRIDPERSCLFERKKKETPVRVLEERDRNGQVSRESGIHPLPQLDTDPAGSHQDRQASTGIFNDPFMVAVELDPK